MTRRHVIEGFSLIELMVVLAIMAAAAGAALPAMGRMYDAMQYRDTVRSILSSTKAARFKAVSSGRAVDWTYTIKAREISVNDKVMLTLDGDFVVEITSAKELSDDSYTAVIRFYSDGSSSGGDIRIDHKSGRGLQIKIDWLFGRVSQHSLDEKLI